MNKIRYTFVVLLLISWSPSVGWAQSKITFQVDMQDQITSGAFIPGSSTVAISGDQLPFSKTRRIKLKDTAPRDSIYTATVQFPSLTNGRELTYQYLIKKDYTPVKERNSRSYRITSENEVLPVVKFDEFAR